MERVGSLFWDTCQLWVGDFFHHLWDKTLFYTSPLTVIPHFLASIQEEGLAIILVVSERMSMLWFPSLTQLL